MFGPWLTEQLVGLRGVSDVAAFPLLVAVISVFAFAATPLTNTIIRTQEIEAVASGSTSPVTRTVPRRST